MKILIAVLLLCVFYCPTSWADDVYEFMAGGQHYETDGQGTFWHNGSRYRGFDD